MKYRDAFLKMKKPESKADVLRFLGILKYLAKFIPNLSKKSVELRNLTHESEFKNLLGIIASEPVLAI